MKASRRAPRYRRKSYFVDERAVAEAREVLAAGTNAEAVRLAIERVVEMERFWRFMVKTRKSLKPGSFGPS